MTHWLGIGNPKYYRLRAGIQDFERMPWLVTRYHHAGFCELACDHQAAWKENRPPKLSPLTVIQIASNLTPSPPTPQPPPTPVDSGSSSTRCDPPPLVGNELRTSIPQDTPRKFTHP
jgi:hypothetical protein